MSKRGRVPALYELVRDRPRTGPFAAPGSRYVDRIEEPEEDESLLSPGRIVRVPVGYFFVAAAIVVIVGIGGYILGESRARAELELIKERAAQQGIENLIIDPLTQQPERQATNQVSPSIDRTAGVSTGGPRTGGVTPPVERPLIIDSWDDDPREPDLNYFHVAHLPRSEADRAATYLAARGVPTARLPRERGGSCDVVVLQGLARGELGSEQRRELEQRVKRIGRDYKREANGPTDFADLYLRKHVAPGAG
ncbi:MAG: hypothetical protein AAGD00_02710 [Planctomycetota bacterium]